MRRQLRLLHGKLHQRDLERVFGLVRRDLRQLDRVGNRHRGQWAQLYCKWGNLVWHINKERVCVWFRDGGGDFVQCCSGCEDEAVLDGSSLAWDVCGACGGPCVNVQLRLGAIILNESEFGYRQDLESQLYPMIWAEDRVSRTRGKEDEIRHGGLWTRLTLSKIRSELRFKQCNRLICCNSTFNFEPVETKYYPHSTSFSRDFRDEAAVRYSWISSVSSTLSSQST